MNGGRPNIEIDDRFVFSRRLVGFKWNGIARDLGVSRHRLCRWVERVGFDDSKPPTIEGDELKVMLREFVAQNPDKGSVAAMGFLTSEGVTATRDNVRNMSVLYVFNYIYACNNYVASSLTLIVNTILKNEARI